MKVEFTIVDKTFTSDKGEVISYKVLSRQLADGENFEIPVKGDKLKLLLLSLAVESNKKGAI